MSKSYNEIDIIKSLSIALSNAPELLYNTPCINWKGKTTNKNPYSEIIAEILLTKLNYVNSINVIPRDNNYRTEYRVKNIRKTSVRSKEANLAKGLVFEKLNFLGEITDYQIPINKITKNHAGKIDIISFEQKSNILFVIELKYFDNTKDTLLRSLLEIFTYFKQLDGNKFIKDYSSLSVNPNSIIIKPAVLLCKGSQASDEMKDCIKGNRPKLKELCNKLAVDVYSFNFDIKKMT